MKLTDDDRLRLLTLAKDTATLNSKMHALSVNADDANEDVLEEEIEWLYRSIFSVYQGIVQFTYSHHTERKIHDISCDKYHEFPEPIFEKEMSVSFDTPHILHAVFPGPPLLKRRVSKAKFGESFTLPLQKKTAACLPNDFVKFQRAYVIYVNHWARTGTKTPYYDNDNIAIKMILDAIVPYICKDDCIEYCENLYLTQNDSESFAELYIVRKGHFSEWASKHQAISIISESLL